MSIHDAIQSMTQESECVDRDLEWFDHLRPRVSSDQLRNQLQADRERLYTLQGDTAALEWKLQGLQALKADADRAHQSVLVCVASRGNSEALRLLLRMDSDATKLLHTPSPILPLQAALRAADTEGRIEVIRMLVLLGGHLGLSVEEEQCALACLETLELSAVLAVASGRSPSTVEITEIEEFMGYNWWEMFQRRGAEQYRTQLTISASKGPTVPSSSEAKVQGGGGEAGQDLPRAAEQLVGREESSDDEPDLAASSLRLIYFDLL